MTWSPFHDCSLTSCIRLPRGAQLANPLKIRRHSMHLLVVSVIILLCKATFGPTFYWSVHTEKCIGHVYIRERISTSGHICAPSIQIKKQDMTQTYPSQSHRHFPPRVTTVLISQTCFATSWALWNLTVVSLERDCMCISLIFRTKLLIYLFIIWKENMYC